MNAQDTRLREPLTVDVVDSLSGLRALDEALRELVAEARAPVYMHPAFLFPWCDAVVADGRLPRCLVLWRGRELVGLAPAFLKRRAAGLLGAQLSPPLLGNSLPFDIVTVLPLETAVTCFAEAASRLDWTRQHFPMAAEDGGFGAQWARWFGERGCDVALEEAETCYRLRFAGSFDDYLATLTSKTRTRIRKDILRARGKAEITHYAGGDNLGVFLDGMREALSGSSGQEADQADLPRAADLTEDGPQGHPVWRH